MRGEDLAQLEQAGAARRSCGCRRRRRRVKSSPGRRQQAVGEVELLGRRLAAREVELQAGLLAGRRRRCCLLVEEGLDLVTGEVVEGHGPRYRARDSSSGPWRDIRPDRARPRSRATWSGRARPGTSCAIDAAHLQLEGVVAALAAGRARTGRTCRACTGRPAPSGLPSGVEHRRSSTAAPCRSPASASEELTACRSVTRPDTSRVGRVTVSQWKPNSSSLRLDREPVRSVRIISCAVGDHLVVGPALDVAEAHRAVTAEREALGLQRERRLRHGEQHVEIGLRRLAAAEERVEEAHAQPCSDSSALTGRAGRGAAAAAGASRTERRSTRG